MGGNEDQADQGGRIETFQPEPVARSASEVDVAWGRQATAVCGLLVVALLLLGGKAWQQERQARARAAFDQERQRAAGAMRAAWVSPAPTLRKGPKVNEMASYRVSDAGDASYNGIYVESGTSGGFPAYVLNAGGAGERWLYSSVSTWYLGPSKETPDYVYMSSTSNITGEWQIIPVVGTEPAPTVSEYIAPADPFATDYHTPTDGYQIGDLPIAPCRAVLGGVEYVVFLGSSGFLLYNIATRQFQVLELPGSPLASLSRLAVAVHECGHGAVSHRVGRDFVGLEIQPNGGGRLVPLPVPATPPSPEDLAATTEQGIPVVVRRMAVTQAGGLAAEKLCGPAFGGMSTEDAKGYETCLCILEQWGVARDLAIAEARRRAEYVLHYDGPGIMVAAKALAQKGYLGKAEFVALLDSVPKPTTAPPSQK